MAKNYYGILGIQEGASTSEIKKAYFRLVKKYSPEKEPERFREIREAYENLKDGLVTQKLDLEIPDDPQAKNLLCFIEQAMERRNYENAREISERALKVFGEHEGFLYYCGMSQRLTGKTGKAVKNFEKLCKMFPENRTYRSELAISYLERGYTNKACAAFGEAYKMGERGLDFLASYAKLCSDRGQPDKSLCLLSEVIDAGMADCMKYKEELIDLFLGVAILTMSVSENTETKEAVIKSLEAFCVFLDRVPGMLHNDPEGVTNILLTLMISIDRRDREEFRLLQSSIEKYLRAVDSENAEDFKQKLQRGESLALLHDDNLPDCLLYVGEAFLESMEGSEFAKVETKLMLLEEWPGIKKELEEFEIMYPLTYEKMKQYISELSSAWDGGKISILRDKLLKRYDKLAPYYNDTKYYEKYPERRRSLRNVAWDSSSQGTYTRSGRKIGRNEPCPCGSGKKYKNCCGRK